MPVPERYAGFMEVYYAPGGGSVDLARHLAPLYTVLLMPPCPSSARSGGETRRFGGLPERQP